MDLTYSFIFPGPTVEQQIVVLKVDIASYWLLTYSAWS
jgi:hypothetical protein